MEKKSSDKEFEQAKRLYEKGKLWEAITLMKKLVKKYPMYADFHYLLGQCYYMAGIVKEAINSFEKALKINPNYIECNLSLAIALNDIGEYERAAGYYASAAAQEKKSGKIPQTIINNLANTYKQLGDTFYHIGEYDRAEEEYRKALDIAPYFLDIQASLAHTLIQKKEYKSAEKILKEVLQANPKYKNALLLLGLVYYKQGDRKKAKAVWQELEKVFPDDLKIKTYLNLVK